jgi:hypothetical protein
MEKPTSHVNVANVCAAFDDNKTLPLLGSCKG